MEIKLDSLINENREEIRINISVKNHPENFDVVLPELTCPDLFLKSVERVTNDIPEMVNCSIKMFADDTKLFRTEIY